MAALAGCTSSQKQETPAPAAVVDIAPFMGYLVREPDLGMALQMTEVLIPSGDVDIHVRIVRPADESEKVPVIVEFTPYTAGIFTGTVGVNPVFDGTIEPVAGCQDLAAPCDSEFDEQFVRRGYAFAYADVRGTGDSSGCLDLRGSRDVEDAAVLIEWLGTQPWSNGKVGFIGASYPGSEAHIAALAEAGAKTGHLGGVIPTAASTSYYSYHHMGGVPYNPNHALGGTSFGYNLNAISPTINPQNPNYVTRQVEELSCPTAEGAVTYGGLDQSGAYDDWWAERNFRSEASKVTVPVLLTHGLGDWNVKPDHVGTYFNDLNVQKTFIGGQWGHQFPASKGDCTAYDETTGCDPNVPWGDWWAYATAFFDTTLKGIDTGMFQGNVAWVQDTAGVWHRSSEWPLREGVESLQVHLLPDGLANASYGGPAQELAWAACPRDQVNRGTTDQDPGAQCAARNTAPEELQFQTPPFVSDALLSGVPVVNLTLSSTASFTHIVLVVDRLDGQGNVVASRENYGYLNPTYRNGLEQPEAVPTATPYQVSIPLFPQEDLVKAGEALRLTIRSNDEGQSIESYEEGVNAVQLGPGIENTVTFTVRPPPLQTVRLS